jgi:hypothetical protein
LLSPAFNPSITDVLIKIPSTVKLTLNFCVIDIGEVFVILTSKVSDVPSANIVSFGSHVISPISIIGYWTLKSSVTTLIVLFCLSSSIRTGAGSSAITVIVCAPAFGTELNATVVVERGSRLLITFFAKYSPSI